MRVTFYRIKIYFPLLICCLLVLAGCNIPLSPPPPSGIPNNSAAPPPSPTLNESKLKIHYIDVGQGDAILIDYGTDEMLIDGGRGFDCARYIRSLVDGPLEVIVATIPHIDHIGGLSHVLDSFDVEQIWLNEDFACITQYTDFIAKVSAEGANVHQAQRGTKINLNTLTLEVLRPAMPLFCNPYDNSIVLKLSFGNVDFLFASDIQSQGEAAIVAAGLINDIDILKISNHGSKYSTTTSFLEAARPEIAIYSAGPNNTYNRPSRETLIRLKDAGATIYGTYIHGSIVVVTDGITYDVKPAKNVPTIMVR